MVLRRVSNGTVTVSTLANPINRVESRNNYVSAFNNDYNTSSFYDIQSFTPVVDTPAVLITALNPGVVFDNVFNNTSGRITITINNEPAPPTFQIDSVDFAQATVEDVCTHVSVEVTTNVQADRITSPVVINPTLTNPITFDWPRESSWNNTTVVNDLIGTYVDNTTYVTPDVLSADNVTPDVLETISGATVTILTTNVSQLDLEYSLDDISYQSSNVFSGLLAGSYTVYVRDQLGCKVNTGFDVTGDFLAVTEPFEFISNQNSIRYAKRLPATETSGLLDDDQEYEIVKYEAGDDFTNVGAQFNVTGEKFIATGISPTDWTNGSALRQLSPLPCGVYQDSDSQLSCEEPVSPEVLYKAIQKYNSCDIIKTQFKSNYDNIEAKTIDDNGVETILPLTKVTDNLEREDRRDATLTNLGGGKAGVYYTSGDTYDFTTGIPNGTYTLNGNLPEYGVVGTYVDIEGEGVHLIEDIIVDEDINARVLVFDFSYLGPTTIVEIKTQYSLANFEVYEFDVDMSFYIDQTIRVKIHMDHPLANFPDVDYVSELIDVKILQEVQLPEILLEIEYYNTDNGEILYIGNDGELRLKNKIRTSAQSITISSDSNVEVQKTDTTVILLNATTYQGDEFVFSPLQTEMARRLRNALSHNVVNINQIGYVVDGIPEVERLGESNLYTVTAKMTRTGKIFNTAIQGVGNEVPEQSEVVALLTGQLGFVKA